MVCKQKVIVVIGGTREPATEISEEHDIMIASVLQVLDAASNLYGIHALGGGESERPTGQETRAAVAD